jgi:indolepyruvate ferredoxin oxidoreductase beta subunit
MFREKVDFLCAGVGGQGTILVSDILAEVGLELGYDVKKSEVHGMAQRGGGVESQVRWGKKVYSPLVEQGMVDYLLGFEMMEAARWVEFLQPDGKIMINQYRIPPPAVTMGNATYPAKEEFDHLFSCCTNNIMWINATERAQLMGNPTLAGVILLGAVAKDLKSPAEVWLQVIEQLVPERFIELNKQAFQVGMNIAG